MSSSLTLLSHQTCALVKTWKADGSIAPYDRAKFFAVRLAPLEDFRALDALLSTLESDPQTCVIRGTLRPDLDGAHTRRQLACFEDRPIAPLLIEVDGFTPLWGDPLVDPEACCREYIVTALPEVFQGASYHWQLSNSAGHPTHAGTLKVHLWFWLATPYTSLQLREWAKAIALDCDHAVFQPVQIHYTGAPRFEPGVRDPVTRRSGTVLGPHDDVDLVLPPEILAAAEASTRSKARVDGAVDRTISDPVVWYLQRFSRRISGPLSWIVADALPLRLDVLCPWASAHTGGTDPSATSYFPAGTGGYDTGQFKCLHAHCAGRTTPAFLDAIGYTDWYALEGFEAVPDLGPAASIQALTAGAETPAVPSPLAGPPFLRTDSGAIKVLVKNIVEALRHPDFCGVTVRYDTFRNQVVWDDRPLRETDYTRLNILLTDRGFGPGAIRKEMIRDAIDHAASERSFDSALERVRSLVWDGTPRCGSYCTRYLGAEDTPYHTAVSLYWWTAHAGRVLRPAGVKADSAIILVSGQGTGKTSVTQRMVFLPEHYVEIKLNGSDDDRIRKMRGKLIGELAELSGLKSRDAESIKALISATGDSLVEKYEKQSQDLPRRLVFVGSSNNDDFLSDPTGNRRFYPVYVGARQDLAAISRDRDQLWAEAVVLFERQGDVLWEDAARLVGAEHAKFEEVDSWDEVIGPWLDNITNWIEGTKRLPDGTVHVTSPYVTVGRCLHEALHMDTQRQSARDMHRVVRSFVRYGLVGRRLRVSGKLCKLWIRNEINELW